MDDLMDMMVADASASDISDKIKEILYTKSAEKVDAVRPAVGAGLFGEEEPETEVANELETEVTDELETEVSDELETEEEPQEEEQENDN